MFTEVSLMQVEPHKFIGNLYKGSGAHCLAYRAVHEVLFNLMDAGLNKQNNAYTGKWKEKEQSSSIHGISITVSKADVLEYIGLCGYPECGDEIQSLPEDKDYVIFADGD